MKKVVLSALMFLILGAYAKTQILPEWNKVNAGSVKSGIPTDPTVRYGTATGFGANSDDVIAISNEAVWKLNNNGTGSAVILTTLPLGLPAGSKVNGIMKCSDGKIRIWGFFPVTSTEYYGLMVSDAANPAVFTVVPSSLSTYQFATHVAQRGIVTFCEFTYGPGSEPPSGYMLYGPDLLTLNGTAVPSTVAFMTPAGVVTDLPQLQPDTENRNAPTFPVSNPKYRYFAKRSNSLATNGELLLCGTQVSIGGLISHGLSSYKNSTSTLTDFNVTIVGGNQAVTKYYTFAGKEYVTWKNDAQPTNGGIISPGLLEIDATNTIIGASGGAPNLESNCITAFDGNLLIGGARHNISFPANTYTYSAGVFTDASGNGANDIDNNGAETDYDLFATSNFIYVTNNSQTALGDVSNYIAVRAKVAGVLAISTHLSAERVNKDVRLSWTEGVTGSILQKKSSDGMPFSSIATIIAATGSYVDAAGGGYYRIQKGSDNSNIVYVKPLSETKVYKFNSKIVIIFSKVTKFTVFNALHQMIQQGESKSVEISTKGIFYLQTKDEVISFLN